MQQGNCQNRYAAPGRVEIVLVWRRTVLPKEATRGQELEAFQRATADVVDWTTTEGDVVLHT